MSDGAAAAAEHAQRMARVKKSLEQIVEDVKKFRNPSFPDASVDLETWFWRIWRLDDGDFPKPLFGGCHFHWDMGWMILPYNKISLRTSSKPTILTTSCRIHGQEFRAGGAFKGDTNKGDPVA